MAVMSNSGPELVIGAKSATVQEDVCVRNAAWATSEPLQASQSWSAFLAQCSRHSEKPYVSLRHIFIS
jgi:hypothetical protein